MTKPIDAAVRDFDKNVEMKNESGTNDTANNQNSSKYNPASFL
jgi:hypothetical protein